MPPNKKINCLEENSLKMGIGSNHISNFLETYHVSYIYVYSTLLEEAS
jgi:hypothetical protein